MLSKSNRRKCCASSAELGMVCTNWSSLAFRGLLGSSLDCSIHFLTSCRSAIPATPSECMASVWGELERQSKHELETFQRNADSDHTTYMCNNTCTCTCSYMYTVCVNEKLTFPHRPVSVVRIWYGVRTESIRFCVHSLLRMEIVLRKLPSYFRMYLCASCKSTYGCVHKQHSYCKHASVASSRQNSFSCYLCYRRYCFGYVLLYYRATCTYDYSTTTAYGTEMKLTTCTE